MVSLRCPCGNFTQKGKCLRGGPQNLYANDNYVRLECNDVCVLRLRQQQLASAFGKAKEGEDPTATVYPLMLTNAALTSSKFVQRIEEAFDQLLTSRKTTHRFPPMNSYYRNVIHQLAEYYNINTASEGYEPYRNVVLNRKMESKRPPIRLSELVARYPVPRQPGTGDGINTDGKPASLLFHNLNSDIVTSDLHKILAPYKGEYYLKWVDDESAVVTFNNEATMKIANYTISAIPSISCKAISDNDLEEMFSVQNVPPVKSEDSPPAPQALSDS